jgi:hypothetical protein
MAAPQELIELVERFARNIEAYKSGAQKNWGHTSKNWGHTSNSELL